jgi:ribonuclease P protein component
MAREFSFGKEEKLKSRKLVEELFATGKSQGVFPLRITYKFLPAEQDVAPLQAGVSASKKHFKKAVDRNRIKRLIREAYRLQKKDLMQLAKEKNTRVILFFIFVDKTKPAYKTVFDTMTKCLQLLQIRLEQTNEESI